MKLARHWTKESVEAVRPDGSRIRVVSRGWSDESLEAAAERGREIARRLAEALANGQIECSHYLYGERPLPEPILREFRDGGGDATAVVTRNSYGARVLNTSNLMFIDIDRDEPPTPAGSALSSVLSLFGKAPPPKLAAALEDIQRVTERNKLSIRVYKTAAGYRAIVTNAAREATSSETTALLQQFGADPLYVRLCRAQESFRARLTPKPWRCNLGVPPASFPFTTPQEESKFLAWEANYSSIARGYATCRYLTAFGDNRIAPELDELIRFHDNETKSGAGTLPLA